MSRRFALATAVALLSSVLLPAIAPGQSPVRLGGEFQINRHTDNSQTTRPDSSVDVEANGDFVAVWNSNLQDGADRGVFGQRFSSSGIPIGGEFQINTYTLGPQRDPTVGVDDDGDFVVAWESDGQDGSDESIFARRFSSAGVALGLEFQVNLVTNSSQADPVVASEANGDFVVTWNGYLQDGSDYGIFGRRFSSAGTGIGGEFQANAHTAAYQVEPAIDLDGDGEFVIVWVSYQQDGSHGGVFGQRFNSLGAKQGPEFLVNTYITGRQAEPTVALDADGDFVVSWSSTGQDGDSYGVFARRFDSAGTPQGAETQVSIYETGGQNLPSLGIDADGNFVVAWLSSQDGSQNGIFARSFSASGIPTSGELPVSTTVTGNQTLAAVRANADGDFVVAWSSTQDGSSYGVFGQRFDTPSLLDIDGNGQLTGLTDGLLILRFFFGFTGGTLTGGAVGANCTRCDSTTILPYLQSLT